jgi:hypothetical protein
MKPVVDINLPLKNLYFLCGKNSFLHGNVFSSLEEVRCVLYATQEKNVTYINTTIASRSRFPCIRGGLPRNLSAFYLTLFKDHWCFKPRAHGGEKLVGIPISVFNRSHYGGRYNFSPRCTFLIQLLSCCENGLKMVKRYSSGCAGQLNTIVEKI